VLDQKHWPGDLCDDLTSGEVEVRNMCKKLQVAERDMIRGFREYLVEKKCPEKLLPLQHALNTIPISSSVNELNNHPD